MSGKNFAITGVAGYIAPRHLKAIKETGNNLIAAVDPHDSVGILDQYFPDCAFFTEIERFDRHLEMLKRKNEGIDYLTICSPNHLHDAHIRLALRLGADVICEKPLVLNPWNLDALQKLEEEYGKKVYTILQLRVHPALIELKKKLTESRSDPDLAYRQTGLLGRESSSNTYTEPRRSDQSLTTKHNVVLSYITSRGPWYKYSWKGDTHKSGGIATNIGIHFFDLLIWLFGKVVKSEVHLSEENKMAGFLELENTNLSGGTLVHTDVKWYLSIDNSDLSKLNLSTRKETTDHAPMTNDNLLLPNDYSLLPNNNIPRTFRSIKIDNEEIEFTDGFTDLHTKVYQETLNGKGFGIEDSRNSIELVYELRNEQIVKPCGQHHPFLK